MVVGATAPDWFRLDIVPGARRVKAGHGREVWQVAIDDKTVFAKVYRPRGLWARIRRLVVGDPTRREWRAVRRAASLGVAVARPVALGLARSGTVYLSEAVEQGVVLSDAWRLAEDGSRRDTTEAILGSVAVLFATAHARGFDHGDAHPSNILLQGGVAQGCRALFLDVHGARFENKPLRIHDALASLAQLDQFFGRRATRGERLRFLRAYLAHRPAFVPDVPLRAVLGRFHEVSLAHAERLARHRDRRIRLDGKYFATIRLSDGWQATLALQLERRHVFPEPSVPDRTVGAWRSLLDSALGDEGSEVTARDAGGTVRIELVRLTLGERCEAVLGRDLRWRRFEACHRDRHRDRPASLILGYVRHRRGWLPDRAGVVLPGEDGDSGGAA